jgi:outer membrane murein-binding lipoprotein Lpp
MTVRDKIDRLIAQPAVGDLGYPADQRSIATVVLSLKLLADSIDDMERRLGGAGGSNAGDAEVSSEVRDLSAQLEELTAHVRKLANTMKNLTQKASDA